jgi:hypothetical protein
MSVEEPGQGLDEAQLNELMAQLQSDEQISIESTLESEISLKNWIVSNPALRQMLIPEKLSDIVPALLNFLRFMLGLDRGPPQDPSASPDEEADRP